MKELKLVEWVCVIFRWDSRSLALWCVVRENGAREREREREGGERKKEKERAM